MKNKIISFIQKHGTTFCALAVMAAPVASEICRFVFYQPEEPEGLKAFAEKQGKFK